MTISEELRARIRIQAGDRCQQNWREHFTWNETGVEVIGLTPCGRATIIALQLNNRIALTVREQWVNAGWHPPQ